jgi:hypothetical protein
MHCCEYENGLSEDVTRLSLFFNVVVWTFKEHLKN